MNEIQELEKKLTTFNYHVHEIIKNNLKVSSKIINTNIKEINYLYVLCNGGWIAASNNLLTYDGILSKNMDYKFSTINIGTNLFIENDVINYIKKGKKYCTVVTIEIDNNNFDKLFNIYNPLNWFLEQFIQTLNPIAEKTELIVEKNKVINFKALFHNSFKPLVEPIILEQLGYNEYLNCVRLSNKLTIREKECLYFFKQAFYAGEIANILGISRRTVEAHKKKVIQKLNFSYLKSKKQSKKFLEYINVLYAFGII